MKPILTKLLKKRGIDDVSKMTPEEAATFDTWNKILSEGEITLDKILEFCGSQVSAIEMQWKNLDNSPQKNERLILMHTIYKGLMNLISAPRAERETLEKYLNDLLKK